MAATSGIGRAHSSRTVRWTAGIQVVAEVVHQPVGAVRAVHRVHLLDVGARAEHRAVPVSTTARTPSVSASSRTASPSAVTTSGVTELPRSRPVEPHPSTGPRRVETDSRGHPTRCSCSRHCTTFVTLIGHAGGSSTQSAHQPLDVPAGDLRFARRARDGVDVTKTCRGRLNPASRSRIHGISCCPVSASQRGDMHERGRGLAPLVRPGRRRRPPRDTDACDSNARSISTGWMLVPPVMIVSLARPTMNRSALLVDVAEVGGAPPAVGQQPVPRARLRRRAAWWPRSACGSPARRRRPGSGRSSDLPVDEDGELDTRAPAVPIDDHSSGDASPRG